MLLKKLENLQVSYGQVEALLYAIRDIVRDMGDGDILVNREVFFEKIGALINIADLTYDVIKRNNDEFSETVDLISWSDTFPLVIEIQKECEYVS